MSRTLTPVRSVPSARLGGEPGGLRARPRLALRVDPTALILDEPLLFHAAYHHFAGLGLQVPQDVSLVCTDPDPGFEWCRPPVAHIRWDYRPAVRRMVGWVDNVARGKDDSRQTLTKAEFVEGGTIGVAAK